MKYALSLVFSVFLHSSLATAYQVTIGNQPFHYPVHGFFTQFVYPQNHCGPYRSSVCRTYRGGACLMRASYQPSLFSACLNIPYVHICLNNAFQQVPTSNHGCYARGQVCSCSLFDSYTGLWYYEVGQVL